MNIPFTAINIHQVKNIRERLNAVPEGFGREIRPHPILAPLAWIVCIAVGLPFWRLIISWLIVGR
jgi:hypothetical protein